MRNQIKQSQYKVRSRIAFAAAAVILGATLLPASAFAQARGVNDGGQVVVPPSAKLDGGGKTTATQSYYGRGADDGGTGPQPTASQISATAPAASQTRSLRLQVGTPAPAAPGRGANDGGPIN
jgi:hypothetical protein